MELSWITSYDELSYIEASSLSDRGGTKASWSATPSSVLTTQ
jgi:hypothetical protein